MTSRRRQSGPRPKPRYYWDGIQWPSTTITTGQTIFELVSPTAQEFMPATLERIRGVICLRGIHATSEATVGQKIGYYEIDDAGNITGDVSAIDTHEEDIALRQIWSQHTLLGAEDQPGPGIINIEVDVRAKVKFSASGKMILALIQEVAAASTAVSAGYLRCLMRHG